MSGVFGENPLHTTDRITVAFHPLLQGWASGQCGGTYHCTMRIFVGIRVKCKHCDHGSGAKCVSVYQIKEAENSEVLKRNIC
jgi:hypothetical protein